MENRFYEYKGVTVYTYIYGCFLFYEEKEKEKKKDKKKDKYNLNHGPWMRMNFCTKDEAEQFIDDNLKTFYW